MKINLRFIKQFIHKKKIGDACAFGNHVTIDSKASFEGMNRLGDDTWFLNSTLGHASYVSDHSFIKNTMIGRYTCIANNVMTASGNHPISFVSVHPAFYSIEQNPSYVKHSLFKEYKYYRLGKNIG